LLTYVNEVLYAKAKDIDFLSAKKIWSKKSQTRELRINNSCKPRAIQQHFVLRLHRPAHQKALAPLKEEMAQLYAKLNQCKIKAVALNLIDSSANQFSLSVPVVAERCFCHKLAHSLCSLLFVASPLLNEEIHCFSS